ncbi:MAG TPA: homoserine kinase [Pseudonocardiaceae bacterium]
MTRYLVEVPASSGNLGSGFDALGLALGLYDRVEVTPAAAVSVEVTGEGAARLPRDATHLVARATRATLDALGCDLPGFTLRCVNAIPHSRGLGSSAAAAVAGVAAGYALAGVELDGTERAGRALQLAAAFEGHADNAGPSLLGGLVIAWTDDPDDPDAAGGAGGGFRAARLDVHPAVRPVLLVPGSESSTAHTRRLLPRDVPLADAAFTLGRAALVVHALTAAPELLLPGTADRLHQPYRRAAYPATAALVDALRAAGVPAAVSGAGPAVLALTCDDTLPAEVGTAGFAVRPLPVDERGVRIHG